MMLGTVYVRMKGASVRALDTGQTAGGETPETPVGHTMLIPAWEPIALEKRRKQKQRKSRLRFSVKLTERIRA